MGGKYFSLQHMPFHLCVIQQMSIIFEECVTLSSDIQHIVPHTGLSWSHCNESWAIMRCIRVFSLNHMVYYTTCTLHMIKAINYVALSCLVDIFFTIFMMHTDLTGRRK